MHNQLKLFSGLSNLPLSQKIAAYVKVPLAQCEISRFSDGEIFIQINENIRGADVFIIQSTNPPAENLMELLIMIDAAKRASASRITAVLPYYGYARQDRKDQPRVAISAKLVANLITKAGADRVLTMDLHASQIQGFFDIPSDHLYSNRTFNAYFSKIVNGPLVVVAPDVGSVKMVRTFAKDLNASLAIVDKRRPSPNQSEVINIVGEVEGRTAIIRDDMVDTAGTLTRAAVAIKERGAKEVLACCTHPVLSGQALESIEKSPMTKLVVADTISVESKKLPKKIEVLSVADVFGEAIMRIHSEESVSILFD
jgi:ribose-phosphate pyrophosphokinase